MSGQRWSAVLHDAGFDGIRYRMSHDPSLVLDAVAMFGEPGEHAVAFADITTTAIPDDLVDEAWHTDGLEVLPAALSR